MERSSAAADRLLEEVDGALEELERDDGGGGGVSQAQIIQRQAQTIAELREQVERGNDFKRRSKTRLKEAAQRLREYRLRADGLIKELAEAKCEMEALKVGGGQGRGRGDVRTAPVREVGVQTEQLTGKVDAHMQTEVSGSIKAVSGSGCDQGVQTDNVRVNEMIDFAVDDEPKLISDGVNQAVTTGSNGALTASSTAVPMTAVGGAIASAGAGISFDHATSAAIDAELALSDSDDEPVAQQESASIKDKSDGSAILREDLHAAISREIDDELNTSSDDDDAELPAESTVVSDDIARSTQRLETVGGDQGHTQPQVDTTGTAYKLETEARDGEKRPTSGSAEIRAQLLRSIDDEIDAELASLPSDADQDTVADDGAKASVGFEISSSSSSSDSSSDENDDEMGGICDNIEQELAADDSQVAEANGNSHSALALVSPVRSDDQIAAKALATDGEVGDGAVVSNELSSALANGAIGKSLFPARKRTIDEVAAGDDEVITAAESFDSDPKKQKLQHVAEMDDEEGAVRSSSSVIEDEVSESEPDKVNTPTKTEKKRELYLLKARTALKRDAQLVDGEECNEQYVARTLSILVKASAKFLVTQPKHVVRVFLVSIAATVLILNSWCHASLGESVQGSRQRL